MSEDSSVNAKHRMLELFSELDEEEIDNIEQWICNHSYRKDLERIKALQNTEKTLIKIGNSIKKIVPFEAELPSETIKPPTIGDQADCNKINTCHVDEFLYDDDAVDKLVKKGKLKKHYCTDCNSRNIQELIYISHSMSCKALQYIFKVLLPSDLEEKQILDVGSRLGAVLYGAYYFSNAGTIVGIEMNEECCDVQKRIIEQYTMDVNRIRVVHSDVMERSDLVANSDIIVINILEFFVDNEKHKEMWHFFKKYIKKGSYLVCNRSMTDTLVNLDIFEEFMDWLSVCKPNQLENEIFFDVEDYSELYLYTVN
ncbi:uncharacterized protein LOC110378752 [Helicoverpa armigera]|uniref:Methyltransferase type 11 domain-containing protein n=1 Tax=Helicoverpa armigera TaxID=29058 RepID=A0A2W1BKB9_HELAM|nr:uncharacterized protein LOC110378752 [Helicoverpa armigera]PZC75338.1 hypothetical protein B5X24_HaOG206433 [Helicoverpa armigera]